MAIDGATSQTYTPSGDPIDDHLVFCVTPADAYGMGAEVCSAPVTVPGIVWYSDADWVGTATP